MSNRDKRRPVFYATKYQQQIILLSIVPALCLGMIMTLFLLYFHYTITGLSVSQEGAAMIEVLVRRESWLLTCIWVGLGLVMLTSIRISSHLVGAFERIIRELDEITAGKERRHIKARKRDALASELLERINVLIDNVWWK